MLFLYLQIWETGSQVTALSASTGVREKGHLLGKGRLRQSCFMKDRDRQREKPTGTDIAIRKDRRGCGERGSPPLKVPEDNN